MARAECLFSTCWQRELLAFVECDDQDARADRRCRRGCVRFRGRCGGSAIIEYTLCLKLPMPLGSFGSTKEPGLLPDAFGVCSPDAVEFDDERLNVFASGARCVSLSSGCDVSTGTRHSEDQRTLCELPRHVYNVSIIVGRRRAGRR